jgi:hypothetical protein
MKLARSTYFLQHAPRGGAGNGLRERIVMLCAEFPRYGYRRVDAITAR